MNQSGNHPHPKSARGGGRPTRTLSLMRLPWVLVGALLALPAIPAIPAAAQKPSNGIDFVLDPATTSIHWTLNTTLHTVHGTFKLKSGAFRVDPATGDASGLLVIDATTGESADSARDHRMHREVLESPQFPAITFRPTHIDGRIDLTAPGAVSAGGPRIVHGILTLRGQDHPIEISVNLHPQAAGVALDSHFTVPFVAWGLKDPSTFIFRVDKQVAVDVNAIATPAP